MTRAIVPLSDIAAEPWQALSDRAVEANGYYLPGWELAANASARGCTGASALAAWRNGAAPRLIGLLPVVPLKRAFAIPLPALVSARPYGTLGIPLLDRDDATAAASELLRQARRSGARALILRDVQLGGSAMAAFTSALADGGLRPRILHEGRRAGLDATVDAEALLHEGLGPRKLKDLRRQRRRLAAHGEVSFRVARTPADIAAAVEIFLRVEASGWKGRQGTALANDAGDTAFIRRATAALAAHGACEIATLHAGSDVVAAGILPRHQDRAFFFKIGIDERFAKLSPGVQLTLDITRHLCADPAIASADATTGADHPMIGPIWRQHTAFGDVLLPLAGARDPATMLIAAAMAARERLRARLHRLRHKG